MRHKPPGLLILETRILDAEVAGSEVMDLQGGGSFNVTDENLVPLS